MSTFPFDNTFAYDALGNRVTKNGITFIYDNNSNLIAERSASETIASYLYDR